MRGGFHLSLGTKFGGSFCQESPTSSPLLHVHAVVDGAVGALGVSKAQAKNDTQALN